MNEAQVLDFAREAVWTMLKVAGPVLLLGLTVGVVIALFQALTSLQEITLTFVPKILVVFVSLIVLIPFMFGVMQQFMESVTDRIIGLG